MEVQRLLILPLLLLATLCSTGVSLKCYSCLDPVASCRTNATCSVNVDSCLVAVSGRQIYQQCWKFSECDAKTLLHKLGLASVEYRCCQVDLCNKNLKGGGNEGGNGEGSKATSLSGKTVLLGTSVLAAIWKLCL
ncbi:CD59 glycoprotein isoform X1 [Cricetulus griseus]|uniref:MAC-inhibitory protein n=1 Tax=Cricetulus griseus TaxID=10029 RepID=A0A8C2MKE5_CRIGR|nr:CD59 glycoprotein isoform X1 [Cricetulus griseus]XP_016821411.1 CD59 glycoprotein isoform X1 [Cricetulus griseus]